ncbi:MAG: trehalose-phosphatase [Gluconacetobacter diazotrophicus]|nr:trehalose-phosphatase [Gluconacetobacter diazotrophicus]
MSTIPASSSLPPPGRAAFLLDFDGTLVDIAPTPEAVVVPDGLADTLRALRALCGDALALVSGRPIEQIDHFLPGIPFAVSGEHGVATRHAPGAAVEREQLPPLPPSWIEHCDELIASHAGTRLERKHAGLVLHYRAAPQHGQALRDALQAMLDGTEGGGFHLHASKMAWEVRPDGVDKGSAVRRLMAAAPFAGRLPVFVGDDVTDEDGIRAAEALGGTGFRIPDQFPDPTAFRAFLAELAHTGAGAAAWGG